MTWLATANVRADVNIQKFLGDEEMLADRLILNATVTSDQEVAAV